MENASKYSDSGGDFSTRIIFPVLFGQRIRQTEVLVLSEEVKLEGLEESEA